MFHVEYSTRGGAGNMARERCKLRAFLSDVSRSLRIEKYGIRSTERNKSREQVAKFHAHECIHSLVVTIVSGYHLYNPKVYNQECIPGSFSKSTKSPP